MFAHFIYFITALLVLSLYQAPDEIPITLSRALLLFAGSILLYVLYIRGLFQRLSKRVEWENPEILDHRFSQLNTRCAILSLALLTVDVWWLHLPWNIPSSWN